MTSETMKSEAERDPKSEGLRECRAGYLPCDTHLALGDRSADPGVAPRFRFFGDYSASDGPLRCFLFLLDDTVAPNSRSSLSRAGHDTVDELMAQMWFLFPTEANTRWPSWFFFKQIFYWGVV